MIKLVATDMDGTFLKDDRSYDKERLATLLPKLKEKGILFAVASGRSLLAIDAMFEEFLDQIAVIAENGSLVQYQNKVLFADFLTKEQYVEIADAILANPFYVETGMLFSGQKAAYILKGASQPISIVCPFFTKMCASFPILMRWMMMLFLKSQPHLLAKRF